MKENKVYPVFLAYLGCFIINELKIKFKQAEEETSNINEGVFFFFFNKRFVRNAWSYSRDNAETDKWNKFSETRWQMLPSLLI